GGFNIDGVTQFLHDANPGHVATLQATSPSFAAMGLSLGQLLYVFLLIVNSLAVLNEDRFLIRIGWISQPEPGFGGGEQSIKSKIVNLISAVRTLMRSMLTTIGRIYVTCFICEVTIFCEFKLISTISTSSIVPLIGINILVIIYELLLG
ncbi:Yos1-like-domain-containing protein, partial [Jimgerdemannia flammicorona]